MIASSIGLSETDECPSAARNDNIQIRVLHDACLRLGGEHHLAAFLDVPVHVVDGWLKGRKLPPDEVFLKCLDLLEGR